MAFSLLRHPALLTLGLALALLPTGRSTFPAAAAVPEAAASAPPWKLWSVEVTWNEPDLTRRQLGQLRARGINALFVDRSRVTAERLAAAARSARAYGFTLIAPEVSDLRSARTICARAATRGEVCALGADTPTRALRLARSVRDDVVVVIRVARPGELERVAASNRSGRILAVVPLAADFPSSAWGAAVATAAARNDLDLAVVPDTTSPSALEAYAALVGDVLRRPDRRAPTRPTGLAMREARATALSFDWRQARDNRIVSRYGVYVAGRRVAQVTQRRHALVGLLCGRSYAIGVDAVDAAGNRSSRSTVTAATAACPRRPRAIPPRTDASAPTPPGRLRVGNIGSTLLTVSWDPSSDDVGVAAYDVYVNGAYAATTGSTSYGLTGLACGTSYALAVAARDARGNRSSRVAVTAATAPCVATPPAPGPAPPVAPPVTPPFVPPPTTPPSPPSGPAAVFVAPDGSDTASCARATPCRSLDRAYRVARPGQVVELASGSYADQAIGVDASKTSADDVLFRPADGAAVSTGEVTILGSHLELRDLRVDGWQVEPGADDVTFRNVTVNGGIFITSASNVSILGGSVGPGVDYDPQIKSASSSAAPPTNILIDGVRFHDWTRTGDEHVECLQFGSGVNVTIRNSRFENCATQGVFFRSWGSGYPIRNVLVENNWFERTLEGFYTLIFSEMAGVTYDNLLIRNNSSNQAMRMDADIATNARWVANVAPRDSCPGGQTFAYNVWDGIACGSTDRNAPSGFVDSLGFDLHLLATSAAVDRGDPTSYPATDIDGDLRPRGGLPDAGADESR